MVTLSAYCPIGTGDYGKKRSCDKLFLRHDLQREDMCWRLVTLLEQGSVECVSICPAGADGFAALTPKIVIGNVERHALDGSADSGKAMCGARLPALFASEGLHFVSLGRLRAVHRPIAACGFPNLPAAKKVQQVSMPAIGPRQWRIETMRF
ncbi:hypothetical protein NKI39_31200 [Mesorhizobium sp. M0664]|uniref:hypothetical protein n=1 Tax=Mesorhizobium sp. M0664 TaxID=2956982 RepID=UPI003339F676